MNRFQNENEDQVQVEVHEQISRLHSDADKKRFIAEMSGDYYGQEHWAEVARRYEALALLTAPPRYFFTAFHKLEGCTGMEYRLRILKEALKEDPSNYTLEENINKMESLIESEA